jgi:hypothetical protein
MLSFLISDLYWFLIFIDLVDSTLSTKWPTICTRKSTTRFCTTYRLLGDLGCFNTLLFVGIANECEYIYISIERLKRLGARFYKNCMASALLTLVLYYAFIYY